MDNNGKYNIGEKEFFLYLNFIDRLLGEQRQKNTIVDNLQPKNARDVKHKPIDIQEKIQKNDQENFFSPNIMFDEVLNKYIGEYSNGFYYVNKYTNHAKENISKILSNFYNEKEMHDISKYIYDETKKNKEKYISDIKIFNQLDETKEKSLIQAMCVSLVAINRIKNYVEGRQKKGEKKDPDENYCYYTREDLLKFKDDILAKILQYIVVYNNKNKTNKISYGWKVDKTGNKEIDSFIIDIPGYSQISVHVKGVKDQIIRQAESKLRYSNIKIDKEDLRKSYDMKLYEFNVGGLPHKCITEKALIERIGAFEGAKIEEKIKKLVNVSNLTEAQSVVKDFLGYRFYKSIDNADVRDGFDKEFSKKINKKYNKNQGFSEREIFYLANGLNCNSKQLELIQAAFFLERNNIKLKDLKNCIIENISNGNYEDCVENTVNLFNKDIADEDKEYSRFVVEKVKYEMLLSNIDKKSLPKFIRGLKKIKVGTTNITVDCSKEYKKIAKMLDFNNRDLANLNTVRSLVNSIDNCEKNKNLYYITELMSSYKDLYSSDITREEILNNACSEETKKDLEMFEKNGISINELSEIIKSIRSDKKSGEDYINNILLKVDNKDKEILRNNINKYIMQYDEKMIERGLEICGRNMNEYNENKSWKFQELSDSIAKKTLIYNENMNEKLNEKIKEEIVNKLSLKCNINPNECNINNTLNLVNFINNISEKYKNITDDQIEFLTKDKEANINELLMLKNNNKDNKIELPLDEVKRIYKNNYNKKTGQFNRIMKKYYRSNGNEFISSPQEMNRINIGVDKLIKASVDKIVLDNEFKNNFNIDNYIEADKMLDSLKKYEISYKIFDNEENIEDGKNKSVSVSYKTNDIINSLYNGENIEKEKYKILKKVPILKDQIKTMIACDEKSKFKNTEFEDYAIYLEENFSEKDIKSINKVSNLIEECVLGGEDIDTLDNLDKMVNNIKEQCTDIEWLDTNILRKSLCELYELEKLDSNMVGLNALNNTTIWDRINARKEEEFVKEKVDIKAK